MHVVEKPYQGHFSGWLQYMASDERKNIIEERHDW